MKLKEYNLIKISFIIFLFSFILLYYLDDNYSPKLIYILDIDKSYFNKVVRIDVKIQKQTLKNQTLFLTLSDINYSNFKILAIVFNINKTLDKNINYEIIGKVDLYKDDLEILVNEIKKI